MQSDRGHGASAFVYHRVPLQLRGTVLYPLNELRDVYPDLFAELRKNYASREDIAYLRIPPLGNCLWNDVLFFSPVHPELHKAALEKEGHLLPSGWRRYFQIDASLLNPADAVIYDMHTAYWSGTFDVEEASAELGRECVPYDAGRLKEYSQVPQGARDFYAGVGSGAPLPLFLWIPHVLYRGRLDLTQPGIEVIEV